MPEAPPTLEPLPVAIGLRKRACEGIKRTVTEMNIYGHPLEIRLDERRLSQDLGMSCTPIREALSVPEQDGFVRKVPRRRIVVVRKSKLEVIKIITRAGGDREHGGPPRRAAHRRHRARGAARAGRTRLNAGC